MEVGENTVIAIDCANAFGPRNDQLVINVPRANLPPEPAPQPGMALQAQQPDGTPITLYVVELGEDAVKADGNHPLAAEDKTLDLALRDIKQAF